METLKTFFQSTDGKRALWTLLNSVMALVIAFLVYAFSDNAIVAGAILPLAQALSQYITKKLNT
jgi:hypothetical protein